jgi:hypothetical protein
VMMRQPARGASCPGSRFRSRAYRTTTCAWRGRLVQAHAADVFAATGEASHFVSRIGLGPSTYEQSPEVLLDMSLSSKVGGSTGR